MKVAVIGGRDFNDYDKAKKSLDNILKFVDEDIEIISGGAKGADAVGEKYAAEFGYPVKKFPADWDKFGKKAGYLRNKQMAASRTAGQQKSSRA